MKSISTVRAGMPGCELIRVKNSHTMAHIILWAHCAVALLPKDMQVSMYLGWRHQNRKIHCLTWIGLEPALPSCEVRLKLRELLSQIFKAVPFDEADDGLGCWEENLPITAAVFVGRKKLIAPGPDL